QRPLVTGAVERVLRGLAALLDDREMQLLHQCFRKSDDPALVRQADGAVLRVVTENHRGGRTIAGGAGRHETRLGGRQDDRASSVTGRTRDTRADANTCPPSPRRRGRVHAAATAMESARRLLKS